MERKHAYTCGKYRNRIRTGELCTTHYIRKSVLKELVLADLQRVLSYVKKHEQEFIETANECSAKAVQKTLTQQRKELDKAQSRISELNILFRKLYEDNVNQKIRDARFAKMSQRYEQEQGKNAKRIKVLRLELKKSEGQRMDVDTFLETVRRYTNATEITQRMVAELIDHIDVYHAEKQDGVTTQHITIYYNCIGAFSVPDRRKIPAAEITMGTRKGVAVSYYSRIRT